MDEREFVVADRHVDVAVVVVTYNSASDIALVIGDLRVAARGLSVRVIAVDNQSSDDTVTVIRSHPDVQLIESGGNLGYAAGINLALGVVGSCDAVLILNPDLRLEPDAVTRLLGTLAADDRIGVVVPRILTSDGTTYHSLCREPSLTRAAGDAILGSRLWCTRPERLSEFDHRPESYLRAHDVDWATGAALLVRGSLARELGDWNEQFFLYSEETDYLHRVRLSGRRVRYEPSAVVTHRMGGSGSSPMQAALLAVNRIRYVDLHHGRAYAAVFRAVVVAAEALRLRDPDHRRCLAFVANRSRWRELPSATKASSAERIAGPPNRGAVIVPAYNEATVIGHTLAALGPAALEGFIELIVVCNGCADDTAEVARAVPGVQVVELQEASKTSALNAGDDLATLWPRLYLDADIAIEAGAVVAVLDRLREGDILAARPTSRFDSDGASPFVRSYYRARRRLSLPDQAMWSASAYGLTEKGHERFGAFPDVTGDDLFVDIQFGAHEKAVVSTEPSVWRTPSDIRCLLPVLRRHHRGNVEMLTRDPERAHRTGLATVRSLLRSIRGPASACDAAVYAGMAFAARYRCTTRTHASWERDESSRSNR